MNKIEPQYVTFTQAKLLKEKGFDVKCIAIFNDGEIMLLKSTISNSEFMTTRNYSTPEIWQVVEWLRLKHNIDVHHIIVAASHYGYNIFQNRTRKHKEEGYFLTPQEAYLAAFNYILKELI
jgi:hypothetical protein